MTTYLRNSLEDDLAYLKSRSAFAHLRGDEEWYRKILAQWYLKGYAKGLTREERVPDHGWTYSYRTGYLDALADRKLGVLDGVQ